MKTKIKGIMLAKKAFRAVNLCSILNPISKVKKLCMNANVPSTLIIIGIGKAKSHQLNT